MARIALLTTGGTIVSRTGSSGHKSTADDRILDLMPELQEYADIDETAVCKVDSTDMTIKERRKLLLGIHTALLSRRYDGIVVTHGTDSMAKTGSYLSFALPHPGIPVILTGAQRSADEPEPDGPQNVRNAIRAALGPFQGYAISFHKKLLQANRSVKYSSESLDAFRSPREEPWASYNGAIRYRRGLTPRSAQIPQLTTSYCEGVRLYAVTTDDTPRSLTSVMRPASAKGLVIEGLGKGNIPQRLAPALEEIVRSGKPIVVVSRCLDGVSDDTYDVGAHALQAGAIGGRDMTADAAYMKLSIALGTAQDYERKMDYIRSYLSSRVADEFTEKRALKLVPFERSA